MGDLIVSMLVNIAKGIRRAVNVWRKAPDESHTAVEYADALLFSEKDPTSSDSSHPLSIRTDALTTNPLRVEPLQS
jgi:hypothetical protein